MHGLGWRGLSALGATALLVLAGCGSGSAVDANLGAIFFETTAVPGGGAGQLYNVVIRFGTEGGAALPDRFDLVGGVLPAGVKLQPDRVDADFNGIPDPDGALTGHARLIGFPRETGSFRFSVKAIATARDKPGLAATQQFTINVNEGSISILSPTAAEGTTDPAVPAFPETIAFVNPANPSAFFSFAWQIAGGSGKQVNSVYLPRELELSVFDASVAADQSLIDFDTAEGSGAEKFEPNFADGGMFSLQAGEKVQIGGFQSPRGPVGMLTRHAGGPGLDPDWFQPDPAAGGAPLNSRRTISDGSLAGGDTTLGTPQPVRFSDYFDPAFRHTAPGSAPRAKYPFPASEYQNAFLVPFVQGVDITPLKFRAIVEAIDTRGTVTDRSDDVIARKAYVVQVQIPAIVIDTVVLAGGTAGVDYNEFINGSGGVPPLKYDLEHVDATLDLAATAVGPGQLDRTAFGIDLNTKTGQFFGVPRASGTVELTVRVYADVMNPTQTGNPGEPPVPTGGAGEFDGVLGLTGRNGRHKTYAVAFGQPLPMTLVNNSLVSGVDGFAYPGDNLVGAGGVACLVPYPVDFAGTYPSSTARRNYTWSAQYVRDASHGAGEGTLDPTRALPNNLVLDGSPTSVTNGAISGTAYDRGFHPVTFTQKDCYLGTAAAPAAGNALVTLTTLALSISPDSAVYLRGRQTGEGTGGEPTGLLDPTSQMGEATMVPMFLAASLYTVNTGSQPKLFSGLPAQMDLLPVMLPNGGNDSHNRKCGPSLSGFWPAESNSESDWYYDYQDRAWSHLQQEHVWVQADNPAHSRVFLWGETSIKKWNSSATNFGHSKRYQQYLSTGKRGALVVSPLTGDFFVPAVLNNNDPNHGTQFGGESVLGASSTAPTSALIFYGGAYWKYYYYTVQDTAWDREVQLQGLGSYIEPNTTSGSSSQGWYRAKQGRTATSIAMSRDGTWCATAMPGGDEQKILLFRTDKQPIPAAILARPYVTALDGIAADGTPLPNTACIIEPGGETASGKVISELQSYLLPDSLMFVRDGLLFLNETNLDFVFGFSLVNGQLTSKSLNARMALGSAGTGPAAATNGQYVPDQDYARGFTASYYVGAQFAFAGNEPAAGSTGPDKVAFVAGAHKYLTALSDLGGQPRDGYVSQGNRDKALLFLETATGASGLDLGASVLKDLTGNSAQLYGDLLTPGRPGEDLDFLAVSPSGNFVAVVRDSESNGEYNTSGFGYMSSFATYNYSSTSWNGSDDLLIASTQGVDMDSSTSGTTEHVLHVGSGSMTANQTGDPAGMPAWARGKPYLNAAYRRIRGVTFGADDRTVIFDYSGDNSYHPKYYGLNGPGWGTNPNQTGTFGFGTSVSIRLQFRTSAGAAVNFGSIGSNMANNLTGLTGIGGVGPSAPNFGVTTSGSDKNFWATFKSCNGAFLYYIVDGISGRNFMVGLNTTAATIGAHDPYTPFSPHAGTVGFEQFDAPFWNYESRFTAVPAGVPFKGRDGNGILMVIASDASAGATSATDLEVYGMDANRGGSMIALTSGVTDGSANAINHLYLSADGNVLVGQRTKTAGGSVGSRAALNGNSDLFAVTNIHAVLFGGAAPKSFVVSAGKSHGSSVAFVGEGTTAGPQAVIYSAADAGGNTTWADRTLRIQFLAAGAPFDALDSTKSFYAVLAGGRKLNDVATTAD